MSMLSSQCDELREKAEELRVHGTFTGFGGLTSTDPLMLKSATLMREAADTIWELRCKLSDMVDERERARVAEAENAKLRELTRHLFWWDSDSRYAKGCQECPTKTDCNGETCIFWDVLRDRARELGIEVD